MAAIEFDCIEKYFRLINKHRHQNTCIGNGDDASVHQIKPGMELVVSTDTAVAGVHWPHDFPLVQAADRAVCAALSDLAAMGAQACWVWLAVMAENQQALQLIGQGSGKALNRYKLELAGGDTVHAALNSVTVTVAGILPEHSAMQRNKAEIGDSIWLVGETGHAALGLEQWFANNKQGEFVDKFSLVTPQLDLGVRLRELGIRCCMDVSDGVLQDAGHIAKASLLGMHLDVEKFPNWQSLCAQIGKEKAMNLILSGGEDYALLLTAPASMLELDKLATCVGICVEGDGVTAFLDGDEIAHDDVGFDHFGAIQ